MEAERRQRVKDIFHAVLEQDPARRASFVQSACGDDTTVREEVLDLLAHAGAGSFLEEPPFALLVDALSAPVEGRRVGPYRIVREIEVGGMGEVYEVEQEAPVRRRVALKLVRRDLITDQTTARFDSERQALALMNHPNIAQVYEAGTTDEGRPYFVMELIPGSPITVYCDEHRLTLHDRLELFRQVCEGVQHAHQKGIIHRDLKPSNVLVALQNGRPVPKIIDFGIAKAVEASDRPSMTRQGQKVGTLDYMSPEQAEGKDVDTRTDVYSLGRLLFELLVGELPPSRSGEPPWPSAYLRTLGDQMIVVAQRRRTDAVSLTRQLRGDLDWIVAKALAIDRGERYSSVVELAIDIRRHLQNEPVLASPPSTAYRMRKFLRRHRVGVAAGALVALALIGGTAGAGIGLVKARRAEALAQREALRAGREAEVSRQISRFLVGVFEVANPDDANGAHTTARELLDTGVRKIAVDLREQPTVRAALIDTMGVVYQGLGLLDRAEPLLKEALGLRLRASGAADPEVADSLSHLAELERAQARYSEALAHQRQALQIRTQVLGANHPDVADSFNKLGLINYNAGRYPDAEPFFQKALAIWQRTDDYRVATALAHLALLYRDEGRYDRAVPLFEQSLAIQEQKLGPENSDLGANLNNLADIYRAQGKYTKAEKLLNRVLAVNERIWGPEHPFVTTPMNNLAIVYRAEGKNEQAEVLYKRVLAADEKLRGSEHPDFATDLNNLAVVYREQGKYELSEILLLRALAIRRKALGPEHPHVAGSLNNLALVYSAEGRDGEAEKRFKECLLIREKVLGPDHPHVAVTLTNLANLYRKEKRYTSAEPLLLRALGIWKKLPQPNEPDLANTLEGYANVLRQTGRVAEAATFEGQAKEIHSRMAKQNES